MSDIEKAKKILLSDGKGLALCKGETVFTDDRQGILPLFSLVQIENLNGFSAADKIVGKAAAMLFAYAGVKCVFSPVMSKDAVACFEKYGIEYSYVTLTDMIINRQGTDRCPMEKTVENIHTPSDAFNALKIKLQK